LPISAAPTPACLADLATLELSHLHQTLCISHSSVDAALSEYLSGLPLKPRTAALAVAAPVCGEAIDLTNSHWSFRTSELCRSTKLEAIHVLNDFQALAMSLPTLAPADLRQIGGLAPEEHATKIVLGPGTGLGVAGLVWSGERWVPVAGEGCACRSARATPKSLLYCALGKGDAHFQRSRAISPAPASPLCIGRCGRGMSRPQTPSMSWRVRCRQAAAGEALGLFINWLGRFAGNAALAFGARGGVYIGGGIAPKITAALSAGSFRAAFEQKGRMSAYLAPIPVYVILAEFATLKGAAAALRASLAAPI
jgi:glucokinase